MMEEPTKSTIPSIGMSSPDLTDEERQAVARVLETPNLSMGNQITTFEASVAAYTGSRHAIGVSSGTSGLHLCVRACGIGEGDLVITTPFSFVASANVLLYERAVPLFVDIEPRTGNIDPHLVFAAAQDILHGGKNAQAWLPPKGADPEAKLKAILPVDVFGQPADLEPILNTAWKYKLRVIEDSCEALGAEYKKRPAGTLGDFGVFGFYPNKQVTTGEGGMIRPTSGSVRVLGQIVGPNRRGPWRQVGHLVERPVAYPELTIRENLEVARRLQGFPDKRATDRVIDHLGLSEYADRKGRTLSTGNLQRLGLARAFGEFHKVGVGLWSFLIKQAAHDGAFGCVQRGIKSGLASHRIPFKVEHNNPQA
jgi:hypothetical protein